MIFLTASEPFLIHVIRELRNFFDPGSIHSTTMKRGRLYRITPNIKEMNEKEGVPSIPMIEYLCCYPCVFIVDHLPMI